MMQEDSFTLDQPATTSRRTGSEFFLEANRWQFLIFISPDFHHIQFLLLKEGTLAKDGEKPEDWDEDILEEGEKHHQLALPPQHCLPHKHPNGRPNNHEGLWLQLQPDRLLCRPHQYA